ncbi:SDR family oxidoreductase [Streptomyces sp. R302]|uniref:SDR family oxidoreductase n=1 Tax=unclassified Streptomyces TaxID=2593676 RepID=UPI00145DDF98|nr:MULTISPECIES: SDR family oxidoreductase [unclassified Streptomyces]NML51782.1 SDR family oxidoreductase [Streptomyces sp. R301]NML81402.1 SDR family oxidoreductase [Streptomyces sp. R302]
MAAAAREPRRPFEGRTVVVTGASAGVGRATARAFGESGARVALLARGRVGLEAAAEEVRRAGGEALVVPVDMAVAGSVEAAADRVESRLGPVDVWVNAAFTSVFAPFLAAAPDEYERVTEVTYLGCVNGTRAALRRMLPRNSGAVVQVGSALGEAAVPLQAAYCGAKHAINGFTASVRLELLHLHSRVAVTVVQLPAVNTPQFSWALSRLPYRPRPVPPVYQPEVAARAVLHAARRPRRREHLVGASTAAAVLAHRAAPALLDRYVARTGYASQQTGEPATGEEPHNLWAPLDGPGGQDHGAHGTFDDEAAARSPYAALARRPVATGAAVVGAVALAARSLRGRRG